MATAPCNRETRPRNEGTPLARLISLGWETVVTLGVFVAGGWWLSGKTGSVLPLAALSLAGVGVSLYRFFRTATRL
jgi:Putative F0F1-ATPase subunit Ca2+/Mg2+ transporter